MTQSLLVVIALLVVAWCVASGVLQRLDLTGPLLFTVAGFLLANPDWGPFPVDVETASVRELAEVTLALVLFSDAARVNLHELRHDLALPLRLLGVGLPLSIVAGALLAAATFEELPWTLACFVGAALAPTDAALSAGVIGDERVPMRIRRSLNVESGLNDGIATPVVTATLIAAIGELGSTGAPHLTGRSAVVELCGGLAVGLVGGSLGALIIRSAHGRGWMLPGTRRLAALALAVAAFVLAGALDLNGFIAAFVAGAAFGYGVVTTGQADDLAQIVELPELGGEVLALVMWFLFGAVLVPLAVVRLDTASVLYALASLTVVRIVPVALAFVRSGLDRPSILFLGWFGPRGLASVVFALLALEDLGEGSAIVDRAVAVVGLTVLGSVVLHGVTAGPGGRRYARSEAVAPSAEQGAGPRVRRAFGAPVTGRRRRSPTRPASGRTAR